MYIELIILHLVCKDFLIKSWRISISCRYFISLFQTHRPLILRLKWHRNQNELQNRLATFPYKINRVLNREVVCYDFRCRHIFSCVLVFLFFMWKMSCIWICVRHRWFVSHSGQVWVCIKTIFHKYTEKTKMLKEKTVLRVFKEIYNVLHYLKKKELLNDFSILE